MPIPVKIDLDRFILMERKNTSFRTPCALEKPEFSKFSNLIKIYEYYHQIPPSELLEVFPMHKNENGEYEVIEHLKRKEPANQIDSTWVWIS